MKQVRDRGLVFVPFIYTGWGPSHTAISIASQFAAIGHDVTAYIPSARARPPAQLRHRTWLPGFLPRPIRSGRFHERACAAIMPRLCADVRRLGPGCPVWLWPNASIAMIEQLKDAGAFIIVEMINTHQATARLILQAEAERTGLAGPNLISDESIAWENNTLALVDRIVSPSDCVDRSLIEQGIDPDRVYRSHFGWDPARFGDRSSLAERVKGFTALFVGEITIRKGAHLALEAWREADLDGEFRMVGKVSPEMAEPLRHAIASERVRHIPFTLDLARHYREADVFLFPTLEEGAPLVCYEAASFGLPIVTGPMGAARLVEHGSNGMIVDPHDQGALVAALRSLASDRSQLAAMSAAAREAADLRRWVDAARNRIEWLWGDTGRAL